MEKPLVSIITVVHNNKGLLERTILSVIHQTYENIEYIIIDGGSEDGTIDVIKEHESHIAYWVSQPDKGLYDAMNRGIDAASGDYLWFINAGDELYSNTITQDIFQNAASRADIYYGETEIVDTNWKSLGTRTERTPHVLPKRLCWQDMSRGMVVCHQSFIARKGIAPYYKLKYRYCADIDWVIRCLKNSKEVINTHRILSKYLAGGLSEKYHLSSLLDRFVVLQHQFGILNNLKNHLFITFRALRKAI